MSSTKGQRISWTWALVGGSIAFVVWPLLLSNFASPPSINWRYQSAEAEIVESRSASELGPSGKRAVKLPDSWNQARRGFGGTIDYSIDLRFPPELSRPAIFIPRVKTYCDILLNGELIYSESGEAQGRGSNRTVMVELPSSKIHEGGNALVVRIKGYANDGSGVSDFYVGPFSELRQAYFARWLMQDELLKIANWIVIALCLPFAFLWFRDPRSSQSYGLFALGAFIFATRNFHRQFDVQSGSELIGPLVAASLGWSALPLWLFLTRYVGVKIPAFERGMVIFTLAGTVMLFLLPARIFSMGDAIGWRLPIFLSGVFCIALFTRETFRNPSRSRVLLTYALLAQITPALHDLMWLFGFISFAATQWFPLSFPVVLVVMGLVLADDVGATKFALRNANNDLELRIAETRQELDELYEKKRQGDAEAFTLEERHRLMREMHDGVGTHLSLLLSGLQRGGLSNFQVTDGVQSSLDELRLLIDARSASTDTIVEAVSNLRHRLDARLSPLGVETTWEVQDGAEQLALSAEATLHVLRMVQESVSNAVRHGKASKIDFRVGTDNTYDSNPDNGAEALRGVVSIADNGCGPEQASPSSKGNGHGLKSMRVRASSLGGDFTLQRIGDRTIARLTFTCK